MPLHTTNAKTKPKEQQRQQQETKAYHRSNWNRVTTKRSRYTKSIAAEEPWISRLDYNTIYWSIRIIPIWCCFQWFSIPRHLLLGWLAHHSGSVIEHRAAPGGWPLRCLEILRQQANNKLMFCISPSWNNTTLRNTGLVCELNWLYLDISIVSVFCFVSVTVVLRKVEFLYNERLEIDT